MIIGITGKARNGKDSVGQVLVQDYGFVQHSFAAALKSLLRDINPIVDKYGNHIQSYLQFLDGNWEALKENPDAGGEVRRLLQELGTRIRALNDSFWLEVVKNQVLADLSVGDVVITDVRFVNEEAAIRNWAKSLGTEAYIIRVVRPGITFMDGTTAAHVSETELLHIQDNIVIYNDGSLEELREAVKRVKHDIDCYAYSRVYWAAQVPEAL
jgi:hypothetical protein